MKFIWKLLLFFGHWKHVLQGWVYLRWRSTHCSKSWKKPRRMLNDELQIFLVCKNGCSSMLIIIISVLNANFIANNLLVWWILGIRYEFMVRPSLNNRFYVHKHIGFHEKGWKSFMMTHDFGLYIFVASVLLQYWKPTLLNII